MIPVIHTRTSGLACTLRAMLVTTWSLAADAAQGIWICNRVLWRDYLAERQRQIAWDQLWRDADAPADQAEPVDYCNGGVPRWLWITVLAVALSAALIDIAGGWGLLADATGVMA